MYHILSKIWYNPCMIIWGFNQTWILGFHLPRLQEEENIVDHLTSGSGQKWIKFSESWLDWSFWRQLFNFKNCRILYFKSRYRSMIWRFFIKNGYLWKNKASHGFCMLTMNNYQSNIKVGKSMFCDIRLGTLWRRIN